MKHRWSILYSEEESDYYLYYYKMKLPALSLANMNELDLVLIEYKASDIKSTDAEKSFKELYTIAEAKIYGMDDIFDDILHNPDVVV